MTQLKHPTSPPVADPLEVLSAQRPWWLICLEVFIAVQAVYGGVSLVVGAWGLDPGPLPVVDDWTLPGIALVLVVAAPMLTAAWLELWAHPQAALASLVAGTLLMGWIALQLLLLPSMHLWLQPVCLLAGALVAGGGLRRWRRPPLRRSR